MRSRFILYIANVFILSALSGSGQEVSPPEGFSPLFNGKDLNGWFGLNPHSVAKLDGEKKEAKLKAMREEFATHWRVENGELVNDGHGPYATTDRDYGDIELHLEYKTVAKADSGIYLRGTPQVQIWDKTQTYNPEKPTRRPHLGSGGLFNNNPSTIGRDPLHVADRPFGKWNKLRIRQIGDRTWVWLNDKPVVPGVPMENYWDRTKKLPAAGPIMLQTHGGEIRWRNIYIREFSEKEARNLLAASPPMLPNPTEADVSYGPHWKQKLHFWKAKSDQPAPLLFFIHGGGWMAGNRMSGLSNDLRIFLNSGISVVSVEYRFIPEATADGESPPVKGPLHDAARALQFVRSKAAEWNIDKERIAASGGSAGACSSLWLAFHSDLANPDSEDPVARESTRLLCAAVSGAQTTLDPVQMREWTPNSRYGGHAFGFKGFTEFHEKRDTILPWIAEYSPYANVSRDDPPVYLYYRTPPHLGQEEKDPTHTSNFGVKLQEHCEKNGVPCDFYYPGIEKPNYTSTRDYLIAKLKGEEGFVAIFNGSDFSGWDAKPDCWLIRNGEIHCTGNSKDKNWLIYRQEQLSDFILRLDFRWDKGNSGVQVRSDDLGDWQICGYQVEVAQQEVMGLWHHSLLDRGSPKKQARHLMTTAGEKAVIDESGERVNTPVAPAAEIQSHYRERDWNSMEIIAKGDTLIQNINGVHFATLTDGDSEMSRKAGFIALQDHGKGCQVAFRNIRIKKLNDQ